MRNIFLHATSWLMIFIGAWIGAIVITYLWPKQPAQVLPWTLVSLATFGLAWVALRRAHTKNWHQLQLIVGVISMLAGAVMVYAEELRGRATGDWEGYVALIGVGVLLHGAALLWHSVFGRRTA